MNINQYLGVGHSFYRLAKGAAPVVAAAGAVAVAFKCYSSWERVKNSNHVVTVIAKTVSEELPIDRMNALAEDFCRLGYPKPCIEVAYSQIRNQIEEGELNPSHLERAFRRVVCNAVIIDLGVKELGLDQKDVLEATETLVKTAVLTKPSYSEYKRLVTQELSPLVQAKEERFVKQTLKMKEEFFDVLPDVISEVLIEILTQNIPSDKEQDRKTIVDSISKLKPLIKTLVDLVVKPQQKKIMEALEIGGFGVAYILEGDSVTRRVMLKNTIEQFLKENKELILKPLFLAANQKNFEEAIEQGDLEQAEHLLSQEERQLRNKDLFVKAMQTILLGVFHVIRSINYVHSLPMTLPLTRAIKTLVEILAAANLIEDRENKGTLTSQLLASRDDLYNLIIAAVPHTQLNRVLEELNPLFNALSSHRTEFSRLNEEQKAEAVIERYIDEKAYLALEQIAPSLATVVSRVAESFLSSAYHKLMK